MTSDRGRRALYILISVAAVCGVIAIVIAARSQTSPPPAPASASGAVTTAPLSSARSTGPSSQPRRDRTPHRRSGSGPVPVAKSVPTAISIAAIGVRSAVVPIGKAADGSLAVPQPGPDLNKPAWYDQSATPGQDGPSVIEGHVDSVDGPSVFYRLGELRPGDAIKVTRRDSSVAVFSVDGIRSYPTHEAFPTAAVYGSDLDHPTLRLITCSNFDSSIGHYIGNTVVYASLTHLHHST
jgi:Sortase domain